MKKTTRRKARPFQPTAKVRMVPKDQRTEMSPEARDPRSIKVRTNIHLDLDVIHFFKKRASIPGTPPYQTQINSVLREIVESAEAEDPATHLRQAKGLIDAALRKIS